MATNDRQPGATNMDYELKNVKNEVDFRNMLEEALEELCGGDVQYRTYEDAGVCTYNQGLVVSLPNGAQFQVTLVQSETAWRSDTLEFDDSDLGDGSEELSSNTIGGRARS